MTTSVNGFSQGVSDELVRRRRLSYIDWARGIAVLLMIEAHITDSWTRAEARNTIGFRNATVLGGFAAPLFLLLAGLGVVLAAGRVVERTGSRARAVESGCRRGVEILLLAFLFRLQAFVLSPGSHPIALLRVDILNVMGVAMAIASVVWMTARTAPGRVVVYSAVATAIGMLTPIVRSAPTIDLLPTWVQWYLRPAGEHTTFTLFPWAGFVFGGAAVGELIAAVRTEAAQRRLHLGLAAGGIAFVVLGVWAAARPSIYHSASFWTSSPAWFAIRVGILMMALAALFELEQISHAKARNHCFRVFVFSWQRPLSRIGRSSLFIYWIHVELVYGYASWLWRGRMPLWGALLAYTGFCALMYMAVVMRDRAVANWRRISPDRTSGTFAGSPPLGGPPWEAS